MAELMLSGNWRNFDELEESLSHPEVYLIVQAQRERDKRNMQFQAALQGVDINKDEKDPAENKVEEIKRRVRAKQLGMKEDELRFRENAAAAGFSVQTR